MDKHFEALYKLGRSVSVEGNQPLTLKGSNCIWVVMSGNLNVFLVDGLEESGKSRRHFVEAKQPYDSIISMPLIQESSNFNLIGIGTQGTVLLELSLEDFLEVIIENQAIKDAFELRYGSLSDGLSAEIFLLKQKSSFREMFTAYDGAIQAERDQIIATMENAQSILNESLRELVGITMNEETIEEVNHTSPRYAVCKKICDHNNMTMVSFEEVQKVINKEAFLEDIARLSRFRIRRVKLQESWWTKDAGAFIGFLGEDNRPVALIPNKPSGYSLFDYEHGNERLVDREIAKALNLYGFLFYRPFPEKILGLKDILTFGLARCWRRDFILLIVMAILGGIASAAVPFATGIIFDRIIPDGERLQLLEIGFFLLAFTLSGVLFELTKSFAILRIEGKMDFSIQSAVWDRLLSLPISFFKDYTSGDLAMRSLSINRIRLLLTGVVMTSIISGIFSIFNLILMFYYSVSLALVSVMIIAVLMTVSVFLGFKQMDYEKKLVDVQTKNAGILFQLINGVQKFKVAGAESRAFNQWIEGFKKSRDYTYKKERIGNVSVTFNAMIELFLLIVVFYWMGKKSATGLQAGAFLAFNAALLLFTKSMLSLAEAFLKVNVIKPMYEKSKPILQTLPEYDNSKADVGTLEGGIEVNHLYFKYNKNTEDILKDVTLKVKPGEYIALVGPSGSGKSTLFRNLIGFEKPYAGRVFYDQKDLEKYDIRSIRKQLGVVLQNGQVMAGELFTNIIGSSTTLTLDDAWAAAKMAGLDDDIREMPMGMHSFISEGASTLSGGQRQRLMIARAVVNKPKVLFFDEATSALDNKTQKIVSESLDALSVTRIVIAHRLSTIRNCDRIIVMDQGRIIEEGSFDQLMLNKGLFYKLAQRQMA